MICRRKRNQIDYFHASVSTETEASELVAKAEEFLQLVEAWIDREHPELA